MGWTSREDVPHIAAVPTTSEVAEQSLFGTLTTDVFSSSKLVRPSGFPFARFFPSMMVCCFRAHRLLQGTSCIYTLDHPRWMLVSGPPVLGPISGLGVPFRNGNRAPRTSGALAAPLRDSVWTRLDFLVTGDVASTVPQ